MKEILTLPISAGHTDAEIDEVIGAVRAFFRRSCRVRILQLYPKVRLLHRSRHPAARAEPVGFAARGHHVVVATRPSAQWASECAAAGIQHVPLADAPPPRPRTAWKLARLIRTRAHRRRPLPQGPGPHAGPARRAPREDSRARAQPRRELPSRSLESARVHDLEVTAIVAVCESIKRRLVATGVPEAQDRGHLLGHRSDPLSSRGRRQRDPSRARARAGAHADHPGRRPLLARQ